MSGIGLIYRDISCKFPTIEKFKTKLLQHRQAKNYKWRKAESRAEVSKLSCKPSPDGAVRLHWTAILLTGSQITARLVTARASATGYLYPWQGFARSRECTSAKGVKITNGRNMLDTVNTNLLTTQRHPKEWPLGRVSLLSSLSELSAALGFRPTPLNWRVHGKLTKNVTHTPRNYW